MTAVDQEQTEAIRELVPFAAALGIEVIASRPDEVLQTQAVLREGAER